MTNEKVILIGKPLSHTLSPILHTAWLAEMNILGLFEAREIGPEDIPELVADLKDGKIKGINATLPYKGLLFSLADEAEESAKVLASANTLYIKSGNTRARNTDSEGFLENLKYQAPTWTGEGKTVLILGTGAAAKAAVFTLLKLGVRKILISGRDFQKAERVKALLNNETIEPVPWSSRAMAGENVSLVVNATPLGLPGFEDLDFDLERLPRDCLVYDLVYGADKTKFLKRAEALGFRTVDGLGMLIFQGIPAFEAWFGKRPEFSPRLMDVLKKRL